MATISTLAYLAASVLFILALRGLSHPETSRKGNQYGMIGMGVAIVATILNSGMDFGGFVLIVSGLAIGGSIGAVLKAEIGDGPAPVLTTTSPTANGATRNWTSVDDFVREVANARVYDGVHYRTSTEVGSAMGKKIGELAATKSLPVTRTARTD